MKMTQSTLTFIIIRVEKKAFEDMERMYNNNKSLCSYDVWKWYNFIYINGSWKLSLGLNPNPLNSSLAYDQGLRINFPSHGSTWCQSCRTRVFYFMHVGTLIRYNYKFVLF